MAESARNRARAAVLVAFRNRGVDFPSENTGWIVDAVLSAIREPSDAMCRAALEATKWQGDWHISDDIDFANAFAAAIDAARRGDNGE